MRIESFDFTMNLPSVLQWQRNDAVNLPSIVNQTQAWYQDNHTQFWIDWIADVFTLTTANAFGLSLWSIILNIPYFVDETDVNLQPLFGYNQQPPINTFLNYQNGNFISQNYPELALTLEEQRIVLRMRYFQLWTRGAIPEINTFMNIIFNDPSGILQGGAWALDNFDMSMTYVFNCPISSNLLTVLRLYDLLPRPAGVGLKNILTYDMIFGFNEQPPINTFLNFGNGGFIPDY